MTYPPDINEMERVVVLVDEFYKETREFLCSLDNVHCDWSALNWSSKGPATLFEAFRIAGAWNDNILGNLLSFEIKRTDVTVLVNELKAQQEAKLEAVLKSNGKQWVLAGFAHQERMALAKIEVGGSFEMRQLELRLEDVNTLLSLIKAKANQLTAFKSDVKTASEIMKFGNFLGELK